MNHSQIYSFRSDIRDCLESNKGKWNINNGLIFISSSILYQNFINIAILDSYNSVNYKRKIQHYTLLPNQLEQLPLYNYPVWFFCNSPKISSNFYSDFRGVILKLSALQLNEPAAADFLSVKRILLHSHGSVAESDAFIWACLFKSPDTFSDILNPILNSITFSKYINFDVASNIVLDYSIGTVSPQPIPNLIPLDEIITNDEF